MINHCTVLQYNDGIMPVLVCIVKLVTVECVTLWNCWGHRGYCLVGDSIIIVLETRNGDMKKKLNRLCFVVLAGNQLYDQCRPLNM